MIDGVRGFTDDLEGVRRRTAGFVRALPVHRMDWALGGTGGLASYLTWMGVKAPDVFGLGVEDVMRLTAERAGRPA